MIGSGSTQQAWIAMTENTTVFNPANFTRLPRLEKCDLRPAERRLHAFFRWSWIVFVLPLVVIAVLATGIAGISKEDPVLNAVLFISAISIPAALAFGLVLQMLALPAEAASTKLEQQRFSQRLHPLTLDQLDAIANQPQLSPEISNLVKDEILQRVRT